jgi:hypothetical protein
MVIQMFQPFVQERIDSGPQTLKSFTSKNSSPVAVLIMSLDRLKRLVVLFRDRFPANSWSIYFNPALVQLGDAMLSPSFAQVPDRRQYFVTCIRAWLDLYRSYSIFSDVVQGFLSRALKRNLILRDEASSFMQDLLRAGTKHEVPQQAVSTMIIDFSPDTEDLEATRIRAIAAHFDDLCLHDQLYAGS